jgi:agmatine deiminase
MATPRADGFRMPAEWGPHLATLMAWPTRTREAFWGGEFDRAKEDYAAVARAVAAFEPVIVVCNPGEANEVRDHCGTGVEAIEVPIDDSWLRDSGPVFVSDQRGQVAIVHFRFNSWGGKFRPWDKDAAAPKAIAAHLGVRRYEAPFVLEGGAILVDGEGTLVTTEGVLLNPNRNPTMSRAQIERGLSDYLGVEKVIWLQAYPDRYTDGHVDGIAQYVGPGTILLAVPTDRSNHNYSLASENLRRLSQASDARGRRFEVLRFEPTGWSEVAGTAVEIPYLNCYLANGAVIMPVAGAPQDEEARVRIAGAFPDREVVCVRGAVLEYGGGGPHCITQQVPAGAYARPGAQPSENRAGSAS